MKIHSHAHICTTMHLTRMHAFEGRKCSTLFTLRCDKWHCHSQWQSAIVHTLALRCYKRLCPCHRHCHDTRVATVRALDRFSLMRPFPFFCFSCYRAYCLSLPLTRTALYTVFEGCYLLLVCARLSCKLTSDCFEKLLCCFCALVCYVFLVSDCRPVIFSWVFVLAVSCFVVL